MACIAKKRRQYFIDFRDTCGTRQWIALPHGAIKKGLKDKLRQKERAMVKTITPGIVW
jgi:hypothetical protein